MRPALFLSGWSAKAAESACGVAYRFVLSLQALGDDRGAPEHLEVRACAARAHEEIGGGAKQPQEGLEPLAAREANDTVVDGGYRDVPPLVGHAANRGALSVFEGLGKTRTPR